MPWSIPDKGEGQSDLQSVLFQEYMDALVAGIRGIDCVLAGCACTAQGSPDMTVAVAKGAVLTNGVLKPITAGNVTITTADATNPRLDLIVADSSGAKQVRAGTAAANPKPPARTANDVLLAVVYVPASDTTIATAQIVDLRVLVDSGPVTIDKRTTAVTQASSSGKVAYYTLVIPNGLFLAGKTLRISCGGNMLQNSGTATWTLSIEFGGTTMFADVTAASANDADRRAWSIDFVIQAQANNDQALVGTVRMQTSAAAVTAPTSGIAGEIGGTTGATASIISPIAGSAAVDCDAADRTLTINWTMSVNNAGCETVMEYCTAELV